MSRGSIVLLAAVAACTSPPPPPAVPGSFVGAFQFTATLVAPDAGPAGLPATTCPIDLDAGFQAPPASVTFYAYLGQQVDAGAVYWQILGGPVATGTETDGALAVDVQSCAPVTGCGCVASVTEHVAFAQTWPDGGVAPVLSVPVLQLSGWIDDAFSVQAAACIDAGTGLQLCTQDEGPGCGLGPDGSCDLVYTLVGVPGLPGG